MRFPSRLIAITAFPFLITLSCARADDANWPQWRGPQTNGVSVTAKNLPVTWSETENIIWKTQMPWWSGSTPIVWEDRIYLTSPETQTEENKKEVPRDDGPHDPGGPNLLLLCINHNDGSVVWTHVVGKGNQLKRKHNMTSPSPVTDGEHLWVMTGRGELVCYDMEAKELWRRNIQTDYGTFGQMWGYASSPLLYKDRLIMQVYHGWETDEPSYLFAVDKLTGKTLWKTERPTDAVKESPDAYTTPVLLTDDGADEVITNGGDQITGHDPQNGAELWRVSGINPKKEPWNRTITSPIAAGDVIIGPSRRNPLVAIKAGGRGEISQSHILWEFDKGPDVPTPVSDGKFLYIVDDQGIFNCLDLHTGTPAYNPQRIAEGTYTPSLVLGDGKIYATNESAVTTVLAPGPEFKVLAENHLDDEYTLSTPVLAGDRIYVRTSTHLYCIGNK